MQGNKAISGNSHWFNLTDKNKTEDMTVRISTNWSADLAGGWTMDVVMA